MDDTTKPSTPPPRSRNSIWELTWDYTPTLGTATPLSDSALPSPLYEVGTGGVFVTVSHDVFSAWTGHRRLDGSDHHGPVFNLGTTIQYTGPRTCPCSTCQSSIDPQHRKD
jgi:hypothetical protein